MELASITFQQVGILFLLIFSGALCARLGVLRPEYKQAFSNLLLYLVVPVMVVNSYMTEFDPAMGANLLKAFGWSALAIGIGLGVTFGLTRGWGGGEAALQRFACIFSNAAYMGFPLIQALFGAEGLIYASAYVTVFNVLLWTLGYAMVSGRARKQEVLHSIFTSPVLYAVILGIGIYFLRVPVPELLRKPCELIASMNTPLSMVITGMLIAASDLRQVVRSLRLWSVAALRLLLIPAVSIGAFWLLGLRGMVAEVVLLLEACPCAAITSIFAVQFHHDEQSAAGMVVVTTLLSILTLPLCAMLLTMMG